jgi:hypothetical protein
MKYTELTFTELVNKIGSSRFFDLPKMLKEVLSRLSPQEPKYKVYTALLNQTGTNAPVATVLENTLGDITFTRISQGDYVIKIENSLQTNTYITLTNKFISENTFYQFLETGVNEEYELLIFDSTYTRNDNELFNTPIEIRVYN